MVPDYLKRYPMTEARRSLAARFGLPWDPWNQDWEWEVAHPSLIPQLLEAYGSGQLSENERFSLMEMLVQSVADIESPTDAAPAEWDTVAALLRANARLHASTVEYWSGMTGDEGWAWPGIGLAMRRVWAEVVSYLADEAAQTPSSDDWINYLIENDPSFAKRIAKARADLRAGRGVRLEEVEAQLQDRDS